MRQVTAAALAVLTLSACHKPEVPTIQDLTGHENFGLFRLISLRGLRDGDRLRALATFSDSSSFLVLEMHFAVGSPTTLDGGSWNLVKGAQPTGGTVTARSVTFLGGQTVLPSIGGTFDLMGSDGVARYRVTIPVRQLEPLAKPPKDWLNVSPPARR